MSAIAGLQGALLLARGRREGLAYLADDLAGARRSFWAALVALPAFICLRLQAWSGPAGLPPHAGHLLALDLLSYVIGWVGFAIASRSLVEGIGRGARWPRFIAGWNWCNVVQYLLLVLASIPGLLGAPAFVDQVVTLFAVGWAFWMEWFVAREALEVGGWAAAGLVALDVGIGLMLSALTASVMGG